MDASQAERKGVKDVNFKRGLWTAMGILVLAAATAGATGAAPSVGATETNAPTVAISGGANSLAARGANVVALTYATKTVTIIDQATRAIRASALLPRNPTNVVMNADGSLAYVVATEFIPGVQANPTYFNPATDSRPSNRTSVYVIDTADGTVIRSHDFDDQLVEMGVSSLGVPAAVGDAFAPANGYWTAPALSPDGRRLNVIVRQTPATTPDANAANADLWLIDTASLTVTSAFSLWDGWPRGTLGEWLIPIGDSLYTEGWVYLGQNDSGSANVYGSLLMKVTGDQRSVLDWFGGGTALGFDATSGKLLVAGSAGVVAVDPVNGETMFTIAGDTGASDILLDPHVAQAGTAYLMHEDEFGPTTSESTALVLANLGTRELEGVLSVGNAADVAAANSMVFVATDRGVDAIDPETVFLTASAPQWLPAKGVDVGVPITRVGKSKYRVVLSWRSPATTGTAAQVEKYRVTLRKRQWNEPAQEWVTSVVSRHTCKRTRCVLTLKATAFPRGRNVSYSAHVSALTKASAGVPLQQGLGSTTRLRLP